MAVVDFNGDTAQAAQSLKGHERDPMAILKAATQETRHGRIDA